MRTSRKMKYMLRIPLGRERVASDSLFVRGNYFWQSKSWHGYVPRGAIVKRGNMGMRIRKHNYNQQFDIEK